MKPFRSLLIILFLCCFNLLSTQAQFKNLLHQADSTLKAMDKPKPADTLHAKKAAAAKESMSAPVSSGDLSIPEMNGGIKQALVKGLMDGIKKISAPDGFLKNASIKLLFPPEARQAEQTLRSVGMGKLCDNVILSMNRAAEDASKKAAPIFLDAIKKMSIKDAQSILTGPDNSATEFLKLHTTPAIAQAFRPVIDSSLKKVKADSYYKEAATAYNRIPFITHKLNPDLAVYATEKSMEGLFKTIAQEEIRIRTETGARSTPLMKKVFGYFEKK